MTFRGRAFAALVTSTFCLATASCSDDDSSTPESPESSSPESSRGALPTFSYARVASATPPPCASEATPLNEGGVLTECLDVADESTFIPESARVLRSTEAGTTYVELHLNEDDAASFSSLTARMRAEGGRVALLLDGTAVVATHVVSVTGFSDVVMEMPNEQATSVARDLGDP